MTDLEQVKTFCDTMIEDIETSRDRMKSNKSAIPSIAITADLNGQQKAYRKVRKLIKMIIGRE